MIQSRWGYEALRSRQGVARSVGAVPATGAVVRRPEQGRRPEATKGPRSRHSRPEQGETAPEMRAPESGGRA